MTSQTLFRRFSLPCCAAILLAASCATPPPSTTAATQSTAAAASAPALATLDYSGSQEALIALDRRINDAGTDAAKVSAIVQELVEMLRRADVSFTAQQAAAQRLGQLLIRPADIETALVTVGPMLTDERLANVARLALEPVPGDAVDTAFLSALKDASDETRLALVQSIGNRRMAKAVPALAPLLKSTESIVASAAAHALGQIGSTAALAALNGAPDPVARAIVDAKLACAWNLPAAEGLAAFRSLLDDPRVAAPQRALALRGVLNRDSANAAQRIAETLAGEDTAAKRVAIEAISATPTADLAPLLLGKLEAYDATTKSAVLTALGRQHVASANAAALKAIAEEDPAIRTAAIVALGSVPGNAETATRLVKFLTDATGDDAKLARLSLARLNGPGVNEALIAGAEKGDARVRPIAIEGLGLRNMTEAMPLLWKFRTDADASVRAASVRALGDIAPGTDEAALLAWTIAATDSQEITRAQRALVSVAMRNRDVAARDRLITDAADQGPAAVQLRLLPVLTRLGDTAALECAGRLALLADAKVAAAATDTLARWPERVALPLLIATAEKSTLHEVSDAAIKGAVGVLERTRVAPANEPIDVVVRLLAVAKEAETRKSLLFLLSRSSDAAALALAEKLSTEPAVAEDAKLAAQAIRANQDWPPVVTASPAAQAQRIADGDLKTAWSVPAIADQWVQVDCKHSRPIRRITLDQTGRPGDFPGKVEVYVTDDPANPGVARASANGRRDKTVIELPAGVSGRYVIVKATAKRGGGAGNWSISELHID